MKAIPRKDDKPGSPPFLVLSSMVPDNFQHDSDHKSVDTITTSDELINKVSTKITKKKTKKSSNASAAKQTNKNESDASEKQKRSKSLTMTVTELYKKGVNINKLTTSQLHIANIWRQHGQKAMDQIHISTGEEPAVINRNPAKSLHAPR